MYTVYTILQRYMYNWYVALVLYWYAYSHSTNTYTCIYIIMYIYIYIKSYIYTHTRTHSTPLHPQVIFPFPTKKTGNISPSGLHGSRGRTPGVGTRLLGRHRARHVPWRPSTANKNAVQAEEMRWLLGKFNEILSIFSFFCFQIGISICQNLGTWCFAHKNLPIQQMRKFTSGISDKQWEAHSEACPTENSHISLTIFEKSPCESEREGVWKGYHLVMTNVAMERSTIFNR